MSIRSQFEVSGSWLFQHRSFLALAALPLLVAGLASLREQQPEVPYLPTELWHAFCLLVSLSGLALRIYTIGHVANGTSGRNTRVQIAHTLNTTGIYSVMRHPLYLGNFLSVLGFLLFFQAVWIVAVGTCLYVLLYERIIFAEEAYLRNRFGDTFKEWATITPTIIPRPSLWKAPSLPFNWRRILRREYTGLFVVVSLFSLLKIVHQTAQTGTWQWEGPWVALAGAITVVYLVLRSLKKHTKLLYE